MAKFAVDQIVYVIEDSGDEWFIAGSEVKITRLDNTEAYVMSTEDETQTRWIYLNRLSSDKVAASRRLGTVPEGAISPTDPGLAWFWDDAAKLADIKGYCSTYDEIVKRLGAPARPQDFAVYRTIGAVSITLTLKARSQEEADKQADALLVK
jgi:hypothetical protein